MTLTMYDVEVLTKNGWRRWATYTTMRSANAEAKRLDLERHYATRIVSKPFTRADGE